MSTRLRAARGARGWSQGRLIKALLDAAAPRQISLAAPESLKVMISRWENGRAVPDDLYRDLFRSVYGLSDEALGFPTRLSVVAQPAISDTDALPVNSAALLPTQIDPQVVDHFGALLREYARVDSLTGPRFVIGSMKFHLTVLEELCGGARGSVRDGLLRIGSRFAEFAGWLYQDGGDLRSAQYWNNRAMDYAQELGDIHLISYVLMRKSNVATDGGHTAQGLGLAIAALRPWDQLTPGLRALALRQKAYAHALANETDECSIALDCATEQVHTVGSNRAEPEFTSYCTPQYIEMEAAHSWARLGRAEDAVDIYQRSLEEWPHAQRRDHGLCLSRLATAYAALGEIEQACVFGRKAGDVVRMAPSARTLDMLRGLSTQVAPSRRIRAVDELRRGLTGLI